MTSKLTRLTDDELTETLRQATSGYPLPASVEGNLRHAFAELQERRKAEQDSEPVGTLSVRHMSYRGKKIGNQFGFVHSDAAMTISEGDYPLYRHAQPAKGLELAGWQFKSVNGDWLGLIDEHGKNQAAREGCEVREVFAMADGVNDRDQVRREHAEWSRATFGNVGPIGPLKHLSKEALEAAAEPGDLSEWADMQFLLWDAQRRAGITDDKITQAMIEKLEVNKQREWPEPKDGEPRLHIKEQPAPVVPEEIASAIDGLKHTLVACNRYNYCSNAVKRVEDACRAAILQGGNSPVILDGYRLQPISEYEAMCATVNSDEWPQRWIPVSERMPEDRTQVILWDAEIGEVTSGHYSHKTHTFYHCGDAIQNEITHWMPLPADPQEVR